MEAEDDLIEEIRDYQRIISAKETLIAQSEQQIREKEKVIAQSERDIREKEKVIAQSEQQIREKAKTIEDAIRNLYATGTEVERLAAVFRLTVDEVRAVLDRGGA